MVSDLKTFCQKGCKIAAEKKVCFLANFVLLAGFLRIGATIRIGGEILCLPCAGFFIICPLLNNNLGSGDNKLWFIVLRMPLLDNSKQFTSYWNSFCLF